MKWNFLLLRGFRLLVKLCDFLLPIVWKLLKAALYILAGFVILLLLFLIF